MYLCHKIIDFLAGAIETKKKHSCVSQIRRSEEANRPQSVDRLTLQMPESIFEYLSFAALH